MRTYDKLIATIQAGQASGHLRPCPGSPMVWHVGLFRYVITTLQEAG